MSVGTRHNNHCPRCELDASHRKGVARREPRPTALIHGLDLSLVGDAVRPRQRDRRLGDIRGVLLSPDIDEERFARATFPIASTSLDEVRFSAALEALGYVGVPEFRAAPMTGRQPLRTRVAELVGWLTPPDAHEHVDTGPRRSIAISGGGVVGQLTRRRQSRPRTIDFETSAIAREAPSHRARLDIRRRARLVALHPRPGPHRLFNRPLRESIGRPEVAFRDCRSGRATRRTLVLGAHRAPTARVPPQKPVPGTGPS